MKYLRRTDCFDTTKINAARCIIKTVTHGIPIDRIRPWFLDDIDESAYFLAQYIDDLEVHQASMGNRVTDSRHQIEWIGIILLQNIMHRYQICARHGSVRFCKLDPVYIKPTSYHMQSEYFILSTLDRNTRQTQCLPRLPSAGDRDGYMPQGYAIQSQSYLTTSIDNVKADLEINKKLISINRLYQKFFIRNPADITATIGIVSNLDVNVITAILSAAISLIRIPVRDSGGAHIVVLCLYSTR